jgi:hypothetical protein
MDMIMILTSMADPLGQIEIVIHIVDMTTTIPCLAEVTAILGTSIGRGDGGSWDIRF